jgi:hypothetical protein
VWCLLSSTAAVSHLAATRRLRTGVTATAASGRGSLQTSPCTSPDRNQSARLRGGTVADHLAVSLV